MEWPPKWAGKTWRGGDWTLSEPELRALYCAVPHRGNMLFALGVSTLSARKADRAFQILRREGLIRYNRSVREWERCCAGWS